MNTELNGRKIRQICWPDTEHEQGRIMVANENTVLEFSATNHGDRDEFWIIERQKFGNKFREVSRYNPRYLESFYWA